MKSGIHKIKSLISRKWYIAIRVLPFIAIVICLKFVAHYSGWEFLALNTLFTAIISANIFLIGFLISGVLVDFKESERLPGELAVALETFADECEILHQDKHDPTARALLLHTRDLADSIINWFCKNERTWVLFEKLEKLNYFLRKLQPLIQPNFIVRLKNEQSYLRKIITRIHTIRETDFNPSGYAIAEIITFVLVIGLVFIKIDPYYQSVFFVSFVSFILIYMIILIKELDNPFSSSKEIEYTGDVSLKPLLDLRARIDKKIADMGDNKT